MLYVTRNDFSLNIFNLPYSTDISFNFNNENYIDISFFYVDDNLNFIYLSYDEI